MDQNKNATEQEIVRSVYEEIASEYDERVPGVTQNDARFTETEADFLLKKMSAADTVLDMGCGTGRFTIPLAKVARSVSGLDLSAAMLAQAREKAEKEGLAISFYEADMAHMPFENETFDAVTCMLALMHIPLEKRQSVFLEASRVLKPGGRMLISVKNAIFERFSRADRFVDVDITDVEHKELIFTQTKSGKDMRACWYSFTPQDLDKLFAIAGLRMVTLRGNTPLSAWLSDSILAEPAVYETVRKLENALGDIPPFNYFGYHIFAEAVKPAH